MQFIKIDDKNIIQKYLNAKNSNQDALSEVKELLNNNIPTSNWNLITTPGTFSYAYEIKTIKYEGLYYVWGQVAFEEGRSIYGYTLYDNYPNGYVLASDETTNNGGTTNQGGTTNGGSTNQGTTNNGGSTNQGTTNNGSGTSGVKDSTVANTILPKTGKQITIIAITFILIAISLVMYKKCKNYKDVK